MNFLRVSFRAKDSWALPLHQERLIVVRLRHSIDRRYPDIQLSRRDKIVTAALVEHLYNRLTLHFVQATNPFWMAFAVLRKGTHGLSSKTFCLSIGARCVIHEWPQTIRRPVERGFGFVSQDL